MKKDRFLRTVIICGFSLLSFSVSAQEKQCHWVLEETFVTNPTWGDKVLKAFSKALDAVVKSAGSADPAVEAVRKSISNESVIGDQPDVYWIFVCVDDKGKKLQRSKLQVPINEDYLWGAKARKSPKEELKRQQDQVLRQHGLKGNCCKG